MQEFPKSLFCTLRAVVRFVVLGGVISVSVPASLGNAQIAPDVPNPIVAPIPKGFHLGPGPIKGHEFGLKLSPDAVARQIM